MSAGIRSSLTVRIRAVMRFLLAFILSLCLSLNAAYAAGVDVCDALEPGTIKSAVTLASEHGEHFGHHVHDDQDTPDADASPTPGDPAAQTAHTDQCHPHQCFTSVISSEVSLPILAGHQLLPVGPCDQFVSAPSSRLERPPRTALA